jgi:hypothetical protein
MKKVVFSLSIISMLAACTHGAVSTTPMEVQGIGKVYRYQGRANFSHQLAEADRMMGEHCKSVNNGTPVVVNLQKRDLGTLSVGSGNALTTMNANAVGGSGYVAAAAIANTQATASVSTMRNINQEIYYKCENKK